jgi:hypothetical protein
LHGEQVNIESPVRAAKEVAFVKAYVYRWSLRPRGDVAVELRMTAPSVVVARREVFRFLVDHGGGSWTIECVSRETSRAPFAMLALPSSPRRTSAD